MLKFGGSNITVQGACGHVIDGNGAAWWDGIGSNGGVTKWDISSISALGSLDSMSLQARPYDCRK